MAQTPQKSSAKRLKLIQAQVPDDMYAQVKQIADTELRSMGSVIVLALRHYLKAHNVQRS